VRREFELNFELETCVQNRTRDFRNSGVLNLFYEKRNVEILNVLAGTKREIQEYVTHSLKKMECDVQVKLNDVQEDINKIQNDVEIKLRDLKRKIDSRGASSTVITGNGLNKIKPPTYDG